MHLWRPQGVYEENCTIKYILLPIKGPQDEQSALSTLIQILRGILQSFKRGIIHRDLKPANILLTEHNNQMLFKIADFGFAKRFDHLENDLMTSLVGTPLYMSPQVLLRRQYTAKCDIYSVGLIYYELIEGRTPWNVRDILELVNKQKTTKIQFSRKVSKLSQEFILGCLSYEERGRYSWENIFTHPLFEGVFEKAQEPPREPPRELLREPPRELPRELQREPNRELQREPKTPTVTSTPQQIKKISPPHQIKRTSPTTTLMPVHQTPPLMAVHQKHQPSGSKPIVVVSPQSNVKQYKSEVALKMPLKQINYVAHVSHLKKDRTISVATKSNSHTPSDIFSSTQLNKQIYYKDRNSELKSPINGSKATKENQTTVQRQYSSNMSTLQCSGYHLSNSEIIQSHLEYLLVLKQLKDQLRELFHQQIRSTPVIAKLCFILSKHSMMNSNEVKVQMIDKGVNCLDLTDFEEFRKGMQYQSYEKPIVEHHFQIFGQYHQNFLEINEVLTLVIGDHDFQEVFNNFFQPTLHFAQQAHKLSAQFIQGREYKLLINKEHLQDLVFDSMSPTLQSFTNALLHYSLHMKTHQFLQSEKQSFLQQIGQSNPSFTHKYAQANVEQLRRLNIQMIHRL